MLSCLRHPRLAILTFFVRLGLPHNVAAGFQRTESEKTRARERKIKINIYELQSHLGPLPVLVSFCPCDKRHDQLKEERVYLGYGESNMVEEA